MSGAALAGRDGEGTRLHVDGRRRRGDEFHGQRGLRDDPPIAVMTPPPAFVAEMVAVALPEPSVTAFVGVTVPRVVEKDTGWPTCATPATFQLTVTV